MIKSFTSVVIALAALAGLAAVSPSIARDDRRSEDWTAIPFTVGATTLTLQLKDDVGRFEGIRFYAIDGTVKIQRATVTFRNGRTETFNVDAVVGPERPSGRLNFSGRDAQLVQRIDVDYVDERRGKQGIIRVEGLIPEDQAGFTVLSTKRFGVQAREAILEVGREEGRIGKIKLRVWESPAFIGKAEIVYANGETEVIRIAERLNPGQQSDVIDLTGRRGRAIKHIRLALQTRNDGEPSRIDLLGLEVPGGGGRDRDGRREDAGFAGLSRDWTLIGSRKASMLRKDADTLDVARNAGAFKAVRIRAIREDVRMYGLTIVYGNGERENIVLSGTIREGEVSAPFDLKGRDRFIDRIELRYRSRLSLGGQGEIEVWGLR
ncbi:MAG: hypothetical protein NW217_02690 [Hyphomicrobiaceae bacterium]|nr:hypothetical protein [Hyphomicrobiaceae bacterium]